MYNQRKLGTILSYLQIIIQTIVTILTTPIIIRYLGNSEYGVYNLTYSVVAYLSLLTFGMGASYIRYFYIYKNSESNKNINNLNGLYIITHIFMSIVSILVGIILVNNIDTILSGELTIEELNLSKTLMKIMIINIAISFPDSVFNSYITAKESFIFQKLIGILRALFNPIVGIVLLVLGYKSLGLSISITIVSFISLTINMWFSIYKLKMQFDFRIKDFKLLKDILAFSSFIFLNMIIDQINWQVDKIILGKYVGSISVAIYSIGALFNQQYMQMSTSVSNVFVPRVNDILQSNNDSKKIEITNLFIRIGRIQFLILILVFLGFFSLGKYFITHIWLDYSYIDSYYISLILMVPVTVPLIQNLGIEIQKSLNKHKFRSLVYILIAILNILLSIPLAKKFGPLGTAIGTGIATIVGNGLIMNWYYHFKIGINMKLFWSEIAQILKGVILPVLVCILIYNVEINNILQFFILGIIFVITYFISIYKYSLNEYEKDIINKILRFSRK